ncbi:MAG TPA: translation elongation factor Ts [Clostridiales bacterium]|jgi:elongation factor Ts|nr:translation elongation factor Ts [Clostridiales bacterium]
MITTKDIQELRAKTGAGIVDCKDALTEANGDIEKAIEILREKGKAAASRKAGRIAAEGLVDSYIHFGGKIGVLVEVNCETDFVARSDEFKELVHNIAIHIAAANPLYVNVEDVPTEDLEKEKEILKNQALNEGKPANVVEKMVEGRIKKYYKDVCLMEQEYVKDTSKTIKDLIIEATGKIGEKISIRRFVRMEVGEGLEKRSDNLAEEVAKQVANMKNK